jgi:RNA polymerase sigma-70 factor, ECF subfamily
MLTHLEDEAGLVAEAQAGNEAAFSRLYNQYSRHVYRLALNITHDPQDAEDVLQDTFLKAFTHLEQFRRESRFSTWLTRIAANEALARSRRRRGVLKEVSLDSPIEIDGTKSIPREIVDQRDDTEEVYSNVELQTILSKAIGKLEPTSGMVFVLRYVQDVSTEATARLLGLSIPAVKTRLLRARMKMRKRLSEFVGPDSVLAAR